ncbi:hypothetical protein Tco_0065454 [Tanacetum coccineum]
MAALRYRDEHNKVGYLQKPTGSADYHQILDFLRASHIRYALEHNPIIFDSLVKQFWSTATLRNPELGSPAILATIDATPYTITEDSVRSKLQLADDGGIDDLPIVEIYSGMDNIGYVTEGKLTFFKNKFSPQWRFLVHTILHCLSTKSGSWDQFGSSLAVALICLSDGRRFNWSSYIFKGMVSNIANPKKFLMFPRFLQTILGVETRITRQYNVFKLSSKLFANMKLNFAGQPMPLLATMLPQNEEGEGAGVVAQLVPQPIPKHIPEPIPVPDQTQANLSTSPTQHTSDPLGGSFHASSPRFHEATPSAGQTSGGAEDPLSLTALSSLVLKFMQKTESLESELKDTKMTLGNAIITLDIDMESLLALANASLAAQQSPFVPPSKDTALGESPSQDFSSSTLEAAHILSQSKLHAEKVAKLPSQVSSRRLRTYTRASRGRTTTDNSKMDVSHDRDTPGGLTDSTAATDIPTAVTISHGISTVSPGSSIVPPSSSIPASDPVPTASTHLPTGSVPITTGSGSIPAAELITTQSGTTPVTPSSPGKGIAVDEPTPTQERSFKQLEDERLGWEAAQRLHAQEQADIDRQRVESIMQDANLARQMSEDLEMSEAQRKRQQEILASATHYSDADWNEIMARVQANPDLSSTLLGVEATDDSFAAKMVALVKNRRNELFVQRLKELRERPMTPAQLRNYMQMYVKNQSSAIYSTGWSMAQVKKLTPEQLQDEFDKIQRAVAFSRGLKRDGIPLEHASSKKLKTSEVEAPSQDVLEEEGKDSSPSQNAAEEEVHTQGVSTEDIQVPSTGTTEVPKDDSSIKRVGTKRKLLGRKGVHVSPSSIPIEEGDPDAEHKLCIKYASDEDNSDCETSVPLYAVVDWELLPTGLGTINVIYQKDSSQKQEAEGAGLVLWGELKVLIDSHELNDGSAVWKNQHTWRIQSWKLYSLSGIHVLETVGGLVLYMFVDKKYPLTVKFMERMLDHQLEIDRESIGNDLTTGIQLIKFLKQQIADSKRSDVHHIFKYSRQDSSRLDVAEKFLFQSSRYVVPAGRIIVVPTGRYVVPAGKVIIIVSRGRLSLVPTGRVFSPGRSQTVIPG